MSRFRFEEAGFDFVGPLLGCTNRNFKILIFSYHKELLLFRQESIRHVVLFVTGHFISRIRVQFCELRTKMFFVYKHKIVVRTRILMSKFYFVLRNVCT